MDTSGMEESNYVNAAMIERSLTKTAMIMDEAVTETTDYGLKLKMTVSLDGRSRIYRPNTDSIFNLQHAYGRDSKLWMGKKIQFKVFKAKGKEIIAAIPVQEPEPTITTANIV